MSDAKLYGEMTVHPPLRWGQIRKFNEAKWGRGYKMSDALRLVVETYTEHDDDGEHTLKTCEVIQTQGSESGWGLIQALELLGELAPNHSFVGEFTLVNEYPEFEESQTEAWRYSLSDGKLYTAPAKVVWGEYVEVKK